MWRDITDFYRASWRFALALPLLFLIPPLFEFAQHVAEIHIGMYDSFASAKAVANDQLRMGLGFAKTIALTLPGYWFVRFMAWGPRGAAKPEMPAVALWLVLFAIQVALQGWALFGPSLGGLVGLTGKSAMILGVIVSLTGGIVGIYFTAWIIAWPLGNAACGPIVSARVMTGSFWRTVVLVLAGVLPLMAVHYALGIGAIGRPAWLYWPMLAVDAIVVGFLAVTMAGCNFVAARHAAARRNYPLIPPR